MQQKLDGKHPSMPTEPAGIRCRTHAASLKSTVPILNKGMPAMFGARDAARKTVG